MKRYRAVEDLQGGTFGMDRDFTAYEWLEQMCEWKDADGDDDIEIHKAHWTKLIKEGREQELIDYIAEVWQLDIQEIKEK